MRRLPKTHKKLAMKKQDEPDFYKMDKENPLPQLPEPPAGVLAMRRQAMAQAAAINTAPPSYAAAAASMNPALARLPPAAGYPGSLLHRPTDRLASFEHVAAARLGGLDPATAPPSMGSLGPSSFAALRGRSSLGMPLAASLPPPLPPPPLPPADLPSLDATNPASAQHYQYQRMRHLQHLQLFQRQMGNSSATGAPPSATDEELLRQYQAQGGAGGFGRGRPFL